jgi:uncharacterized protein involved in tolerance to divalent cations
MKEENYETHFQKTDIVEFTLKDGSLFGYRPMTGGEENDYMKDYMLRESFIDVNGNTASRLVEDITKINMIKCYNLIKTPYKNWENKTNQEKWELFKKLKKEIFSEIIQNINRIDKGETENIKNC